MSPSPGASNPGSSKRHGIDPAAQAALEAAAEWMRGPAKEKTYFSSPIENAYYHRDLGTHPTSAPMAEVAAWLKERVPAESRPAVVEAYFDPSSWEPPKVPQDYPQRQVATCLEVFVVEAPPTDLLRGIKARYAQFAERPRGEFGAKPGERAFFRVPSVERVNLLLALLPSTPEVLEFEELLVTSMFSPQQRASWGRDFAVNCAGVLARLHEAGRFQEAMLTDLIRDHPPLLAVAASGYSTFGGDGYLVHAPLRGRFPAVAAAIACDRLAGVLAKMEPGTNEVLGDVKEFRGLPVWLTAVDVLYRRLQGAFDGADTEDAEAAGMLGERVLDRWAPGDLSEAEEGAAAQQLKKYPAEFLKTLIGPAKSGRRILCRAIGWMDVYPFIACYSDLAEREGPRERSAAESTEPEDFVVDSREVLEAMEQAGEARVTEVMELFSGERDIPMRIMKVYHAGKEGVQKEVPIFAAVVWGADDARVLVEAVRGTNGAEIERGLAKRSQQHVLAFGLLPQRGGEKELLARFNRLRRFSAEANQYKPGRRDKERAVATAALMMMGERAGYGSFGEFEVEMESRAARASPAARSTWKVGPVSVQLVLDARGAKLRIEQGGKELASVPAAVRKSKVYEEAKQARDDASAQVRRMRGLFESLLVSQAATPPSTVLKWREIPAAWACLASVVLRNSKGEFGTLSAEGDTLTGIAQKSTKIGEFVQVAEATDLEEAGVLSAWQAEVAARGVAQPFKQVFRETYAFSDADGEASEASARFQGRPLDAAKARALLAGRGWKLAWGPKLERIYAKRFHAHGLEARWWFEGLYHYLGEDRSTPPVSGKIAFERIGGAGGGTIPLEQVPAIVFSEAMRDADLVVSVARVGGRGAPSTEVLERRRQLVAALAHFAGLPGVKVEGEFAEVRGKRASYRVSLGSGDVFVEPEHRLLAIPSKIATAKAPFLPFPVEDAADELVVARVFLFANDGAIKDKELLALLNGA